MYISIDPVAKKKMFFLLTQMATCLHAVFTPLSFMYKKFKHLFNKRYFEGFVLKFKGVVYYLVGILRTVNQMFDK